MAAMKLADRDESTIAPTTAAAAAAADSGTTASSKIDGSSGHAVK